MSVITSINTAIIIVTMVNRSATPINITVILNIKISKSKENILNEQTHVSKRGKQTEFLKKDQDQSTYAISKTNKQTNPEKSTQNIHMGKKRGGGGKV